MEINKIRIMRVLTILMTLFIIGCHNHKGNDHDHGEENTKESQVEEQSNPADTHQHGPNGEHVEIATSHDDEDIALTMEQAKTIQLQLGDFTNAKTTGYVEANGVLGLPPNAYASVNAKTEGTIVNSIKIVEGDVVKKGQLIAYLENPQIIQKQQEYLEAKAQLNFLNKELERQQKLYDENAGALSHVQKAESERSLYRAKVQGLKKYLNFLGMSTSKLSYATIQSKAPIVAPMDGFVTQVSYHNGMTVSTNQELIEVINEEQLHIELNVFESDVAKIKEGQKVTYTIDAYGGEIFEGEITGIGKEFNAESKTVAVHAHVSGTNQPKFIKDLYLQAKIWLDDQTGTVLPEEALIREGDKDYIYVTKNSLKDDKLYFRKVLVKVGNKSKGKVEVNPLDSIAMSESIVVNGAYYVYAKSVSGELEHSH